MCLLCVEHQKLTTTELVRNAGELDEYHLYEAAQVIAKDHKIKLNPSVSQKEHLDKLTIKQVLETLRDFS
jgi:hypothetical protein